MTQCTGTGAPAARSARSRPTQVEGISAGARHGAT